MRIMRLMRLMPVLLFVVRVALMLLVRVLLRRLARHWMVRPGRVGRVRVGVRVPEVLAVVVHPVEQSVAAHVRYDVVHAEVVPVHLQRALLRELLPLVGLVDLTLQIFRVRAFLLVGGDATRGVGVGMNVAQTAEPLRTRSLFVVLVERHVETSSSLSRVRRVTVPTETAVVDAAAASFLFQRGFPTALLKFLLLVVLRLALASEHLTRRDAGLVRGAPVVLGLGRVLGAVRGRHAAAGGTGTHAAGGTAGRAVVPAGRGARGEESLALLQVHRDCDAYAFRDFASTAPSCGAERGRCDARAKRRGYRQETPKSVGRDLRVLSALPLGAARSAAALRGS